MNPTLFIFVLHFVLHRLPYRNTCLTSSEFLRFYLRKCFDKIFHDIITDPATHLYDIFIGDAPRVHDRGKEMEEGVDGVRWHSIFMRSFWNKII